MGAYVTHRSTPPVAAAVSNGNSEPPETSTDSPGPSTSTSKEERYPSSPDDIRPLPKAGPRKSQNVNKKKRTANLTDTSVKNAVKNTTHVLEQMRKTGSKERGNRSVYNISSEIFTKQTPKKHQQIEKCKRHKRRWLQGYFMSELSWRMYSRSASRKMWIQCIQCQLWAHEKCTDSSPTLICSNYQSDGSQHFRLKINAVGCRLLLLHCVSFASNFLF